MQAAQDEPLHVFQINRTNPPASGVDHVLATVGDLHVAVRINGGTSANAPFIDTEKLNNRSHLNHRDLSPVGHPAMGRVPVTFEPTRLGGATGWGAEPQV